MLTDTHSDKLLFILKQEVYICIYSIYQTNLLSYGPLHIQLSYTHCINFRLEFRNGILWQQCIGFFWCQK